MARKRAGFVPIGDVVAGGELPGGLVLTHHAATPQARSHFTQLDQVTQLVGASEADADLGFMARMLVLCSLPRTNPGDEASVRPAQWTVHALHDRQWQREAPIRQHSSSAPGVGLHRSGTDAKP